jgi:hypothetical protein
MPRQKKRPTRSADEKRPIELTDDEVMEHLYSKEVRDKLKETARKADRNKEKPLHK